MNIEEFNSINEKLINRLNEDADPLTPANDPNDIKNSLKIKADKKNAEKQEAYDKRMMTDPNTKIGRITRLNHKIKVRDAIDAENDKRTYNIGLEAGEGKKGILEGFESLIAEIDNATIPQQDDGVVKNINVDTARQEDLSLHEGLLKSIKAARQKKKDDEKVKLHTQITKELDNAKTDLKVLVKQFDELEAIANSTKKDKDRKKANEVYAKINELDAKIKNLTHEYEQVDSAVADIEFRTANKINEELLSLFEAAEKISAEIQKNINDEKNADEESKNSDLEIPEIKQTGDPDVDNMIGKIVIEINKEKTKEAPDKKKIRSYIMKIRTLMEK